MQDINLHTCLAVPLHACKDSPWDISCITESRQSVRALHIQIDQAKGALDPRDFEQRLSVARMLSEARGTS